MPAEYSGLAPRHHRIERRVEQTLKTAVAIISKTGHLAAFAGANDQILTPIAVQVEPRYSRAELAKAAGQQRLALEIVERVLVVGVLQELTQICEERGSVGAWLRHFNAFTLQRSHALTLINLIQPISHYVTDDGCLLAAPSHLDGHAICGLAGGEDQEWLASSHVTTTADHLLALQRHCAAEQFNFCANALGIGRQPLQTHRHARCRGVVAIKPCRPIQIIDYKVEVAIPIEIRQRHGVMNAGLAGAPSRGDIVEVQVAAIAEGDNGRLKLWIKAHMLH